MFDEIVGKSDALHKVLKEIETVGPTESTVLIHGETGTGKELIARAIHNLSPRRSNAFVKVNCAVGMPLNYQRRQASDSSTPEHLEYRRF
jgi:transcriptional regulator with GAF, ATPase, and Fis domain